MINFAVFQHKDISIRLPVAADLDTIQRLRNDATTWIHLGDPRPVGPADQKAWFDSIGWKSGKMYFVAFDSARSFIGLLRFDELDMQNRSLRIGLDVLPELRGKGFGGKIYEAIKFYAFNHLNIHRLWLEVLETNTYAMHLYEKWGFTEEGRFREAIFRDGKWVDYVIMSILEREYRGTPGHGPGPQL